MKVSLCRRRVQSYAWQRVGTLDIRELDTVKRITDDFIDAVYIVDREFRIIHVNHAFRRFFRYHDRQPQRCSEHLRMGICENACVLVDCMREKKVARWRETTSTATRDGIVNLSVSAYPLLAEDGEVAGAVAFLRDISAEIDLQGANREVRDILENIKQSIFTVTPDLRISPQYSRHVQQVFGEVEVAGVGIADFLFPREAQADSRQKLEDWARLAFSQPHLPWEIVSQLVQREIEYVRPDSAPRQLRIAYEPIRIDDAINRLMVLTEDVTETLALQAKVQKKEKENQDNLEQIAELIHLDPDIFNRFLSEAVGLVDQTRLEMTALSKTAAPERPGKIDSIFRNIHTLKGNARSFKLNLIASRAHWIEDLFAGVRDATRALDDDIVAQIEERLLELQELVERAGSLRDRVLRRPTPGKDLGRTRGQNRKLTLSVEVDRLSELRRICAQFARADRELLYTTDDLDQLLAKVRSLTHVPFARLLSRLHRMVPDLASHLKKEVNELQIDGAGLEVDLEVLNILGDPLVHILRNSVDHGIESSSQERLERGKPAAATISIRISKEQGWVFIDVEDDGRGVDPERVLKKAVKSGLVREDEVSQYTEEKAIDLIFAPGFSTAEAVTDVSGRGVGMDAVRTALTKLGGTATVHSTLGERCRIRLSVPEEVTVNGTNLTGITSATESKPTS